MGAAVVAGMDAAPVLEFAEHVLGPVALEIECVIVRDLQLSIGL